MFTHGQSGLVLWLRRVAGISVVLILLAITAGCERVPSFHLANLAQPVGLGIDPGRFPGPGKFQIDIIVFNGILMGSVTCDNDVSISPTGPPQALPDRQITPMLIDIPSSLPSGTATCFAPTSGGKRPFTIEVGPPPPPTGHPPRICMDLKTDRTAYEPGEIVNIKMKNVCTEAIRLRSRQPWSIYEEATGQLVYTSSARLEITLVYPDQQLTWVWDQKDNNGQQIPSGRRYAIELHTLSHGMIIIGFNIVAELLWPMTVKRFDINGDNLIDDSEFFNILDAWIAGELSDDDFVRAVDLWISQQPISSADGVNVSARPQPRWDS